jgi:hypothetical protein
MGNSLGKTQKRLVGFRKILGAVNDQINPRLKISFDFSALSEIISIAEL